MANTKNSRGTRSKASSDSGNGAKKKQTNSSASSGKKSTSGKGASGKQPDKEKNTYQEQQTNRGTNKSVVIIVSLLIALLLELSNLNLLGQIGGYIQLVQFGLFGIMAYIFPIAGFLFVIYLLFRRKKSFKNVLCYIVLFICLCALTHLVTGMSVDKGSLSSAWENSARSLSGGGIIGGAIAVGLGSTVSRAGAYIIIILAILVSILFISEYPIAEKISGLLSRRREYVIYDEEYDEDPYQYELDDYDEPDEYVPQKRSRKKREYDSRAEVIEEDRSRKEAMRRSAYANQKRAQDHEGRQPLPRISAEPLPEQNKRAKVYEGTDKDGNYIKIVHVPSAKKAKPANRAELNRTNKKSQAVREMVSPAQMKRSGNKTKGLGEGLEFYPLDANGDEVHEITDHSAKNRRYAIEEAEAKMAAAANETNEFTLPEEQPVPPPAKDNSFTDIDPETETVFSKASEKKTGSASQSAASKKAEPAGTKTNETASSGASRTKPRKKSTDDGYQYPPLDLLDRRKARSAGGNDDLQQVSRKLELILSTYGVNAKVIDAQEGPSVTRYELQPELGTRVNRITSLADDLKLNLAVPDIRIEAPIPGRAAIGIEIPNKTKETVYMRELLEEPTLISHPSKIAYAAGKDISGNVVVSDIAQMPHLLVAGTTGSGKSIFVNTILMTILYRAKPSEVGLIIIDPKKVEFGVYSGIPHLVQDVVTDPGQAVSTLRWAVVEMTNRYQRMQLSGVRDFKSYNAKFDKGQLNPEEENPKRMPQIVIVIDELADLMMVASKETESLICRLAQLARAAGIHLIIATQRPSVDVVTGLIKANIPARVALLVASGTDSRTIIDSNGAEKLLGKGDMLFYPTGYVKPVRVQGAFVSEREVYDTIQFIKTHNEAGYYSAEAEEIESYMNSSGASSTGIPGLTGDDAGGSDSKFDEYFYEAGKLCIETGKASSSMIQRRFQIGFNRAARIVDQLEEVGAVGPQNGAKPREILVDELQFEEIWSSLQ